MRLSDIVALAKAGYKASEIKELLTLKDPEPEPEPKNGGADPGDKKGGTGSTDPAPEPKEPEKGKPKPDTPAEPDYKALYEKAAADLKAAQDANRKTGDNKPGKTPEEIALEHFNNLLK